MTEPTTPSVDTSFDKRIDEAVAAASGQSALAVAAQVNVGEVHVSNTYNYTSNNPAPVSAPKNNGHEGSRTEKPSKVKKRHIDVVESNQGAPNTHKGGSISSTSGVEPKKKPLANPTQNAGPFPLMTISGFDKTGGEAIDYTIFREGGTNPAHVKVYRDTPDGATHFMMHDKDGGDIHTVSNRNGFEGVRRVPNQYGNSTLLTVTVTPKSTTEPGKVDCTDSFWDLLNPNSAVRVKNPVVDAVTTEAIQRFFKAHPTLAGAIKGQQLATVAGSGLTVEEALAAKPAFEACPITNTNIAVKRVKEK